MEGKNEGGLETRLGIIDIFSFSILLVLEVSLSLDALTTLVGTVRVSFPDPQYSAVHVPYQGLGTRRTEQAVRYSAPLFEAVHVCFHVYTFSLL